MLKIAFGAFLEMVETATGFLGATVFFEGALEFFFVGTDFVATFKDDFVGTFLGATFFAFAMILYLNE
jgi:hypothetical protein